MPEAKFVLKEPNSDSSTLIYLFFNFNYQRLKYSTGEKVLPKYWNSRVQRVKESKSFPEHYELNTRLDKMQSGVKNVYRRLLNNEVTVDPKILKEELDKELKKDVRIKEKVTFIGFVDSYIEQVNDERKPATITTYKTTLKHISEYSESRRAKLTFDSINEDFYYDFKSYLVKEKKFANNTVGKQIKTIKAFMSVAYDRKLTTNLDYKSRFFKAEREDTFQIYLTKQEIESIYKFNLNTPQHKHLEKVRDLFVIACNTGFRFSDYNIRPENFFERDGRKMIRIKTIKTGEEVIIPINQMVASICEKYNWVLPKPLSNQKTNEYLKDIGELAEIDEPLSITTNKGVERTDQVVLKYQMITTHTARRSFATNAYLEGVQTISIMRMTGHRTEKSFLQYIRIGQEENAMKVANHSFFKE